jgi:hypothetical protein
MKLRNYFLFALLLAVLIFVVDNAHAQSKAYDKITNHLETKYQAKKVKIPFMWLAKMAVKIVRPAGVKSFNVTLYENLTFSKTTLDAEMQAAMKDSLGSEWSPIVRVRSREGQQVYMYMHDEGENVRLMFVAIDQQNATVVRAKFNAERFVEFLNNPKIFGIPLKDKSEENKTDDKPQEQIIIKDKSKGNK